MSNIVASYAKILMRPLLLVFYLGLILKQTQFSSDKEIDYSAQIQITILDCKDTRIIN